MTDSKKIQRGQRGQRGQVIVLGVVTLVVLAFMTMLSFNVGNAVDQRIRLQAHSDSMAYSIAVTEARAFNYYAYSNRAIAAVLVAQATLHGYHSIATCSASIMWAGAIAFFEIAAIEIGLCCSCPWCACVWHCWDALEAVFVAFDYIDESDTWSNTINGLEGAFNRAVKALGMANDAIHNSQTVMGVDMVARFLRGTAGEFSGVSDANMKCANTLPTLVAGMNEVNYACALEGAATDVLCAATIPGVVNKASIEGRVPRSKVITNVANAALPRFDTDRSPLGIPYIGLKVLQRAQSIPSGGINTVTYHEGGSRITNGSQRSQCQSSSNNTEGSTACGWDFGVFGSVGWRHGVGAMIYQADVESNRQGGDHNALLASGFHTGQHDKFRNTQWGNDDLSTDCLIPNQSNCFINFRADTANNPYYQQPKVYAGYKGSMRDLRDNCGKRQPWEMNTTGKVTVGDGQRPAGKLTFVPKSDAHAISKAMVYYHRFDNWKAAPNMFDPYWRAKLHPFDGKIEAAAAMAAAGDTGNVAAAIGPIEGKFP